MTDAPAANPGSLSLYSEKNAAYAARSTEQRIALLQETKKAAITEKELAKRQRDAEELDAKLRYIVEEVADREYNRMGSMAGANSKTFDQYRSAKRREAERVAAMEQAEAQREAKRKYEEEIGAKNAAEAKKTDKRRAKRQKEKARKKKKAAENTTIPQPAPVAQPDLD